MWSDFEMYLYRSYIISQSITLYCTRRLPRRAAGWGEVGSDWFIMMVPPLPLPPCESPGRKPKLQGSSVQSRNDLVPVGFNQLEPVRTRACSPRQLQSTVHRIRISINRAPPPTPPTTRCLSAPFWTLNRWYGPCGGGVPWRQHSVTHTHILSYTHSQAHTDSQTHTLSGWQTHAHTRSQTHTHIHTLKRALRGCANDGRTAWGCRVTGGGGGGGGRS